MVLCAQPEFTIRRKPTTRRQIVHVRMIAQVACPRLQDADHADLTADKTRVERQLLKRCGRTAKEEIVEYGLMAAGKAMQRLRQGEGDEEVGGRQQPALLLHQPCLTCILLALWTVPIATGMIAVPVLLTP